MYRIFLLSNTKSHTNPNIKMYWNRRLNEWTFDAVTLVNLDYAFWFVLDQYKDNKFIEHLEDIDGNPYTNYYFYGIETVYFIM